MTVDLTQAGTFLRLAAFSSSEPCGDWHAHVLERLRKGATEYHDTGLNRPVLELLQELAEEAADVGGWAAVTRQSADTQSLPDHVLDQLDLILYAVAELGAQIHSKIAEAQQVVREEVGA